VEKPALKLIVTSPIPEAISFNADNLPKPPIYNLPFNLEFKSSESLNIGLSEL
jgi:hypothetical protein